MVEPLPALAGAHFAAAQANERVSWTAPFVDSHQGAL
jgi:hypothetical protein